MDSHDLAEAILSRLPAYQVSLSIDHNVHKTCYETVGCWFRFGMGIMELW